MAGINSAEVAYGFGQMGSAYSSGGTKITAPHGMVIVAIQFLADNTPTELTASTEDNASFPGHDTAAHNGDAYDTVDASVAINSGAIEILIHNTNAAVGVAVGDYVNGAGFAYGTKVTAINTSSSDKKFTIDTATTANMVDDQRVYFTTPWKGASTTEGTGGVAFSEGTDVKFPKGLTIYGRWVSVTPESDDDGGVICYFGN
tara:strand:+ start:736 stop:1341 length:606 start_codon:yes stop_codon:yes gene_type:complete